MVSGLWSQGIGVCNVCYALKTRYTRYSVDYKPFKVLHFRYTGCYNPLHSRPADRVYEYRNQLILSG